MTACISRTFMWHDLWDADHCPCVECEPNWAPQPELDASVKRVTSVSLAARGRPCRTAGDDHHATSDRTHCGTWIRSDQFPVLWHHAVAAHHWTGRRRSRPLRTSEAMNTSMPRSLCRSYLLGILGTCFSPIGLGHCGQPPLPPLRNILAMDPPTSLLVGRFLTSQSDY